LNNQTTFKQVNVKLTQNNENSFKFIHIHSKYQINMTNISK